MSNDQKNDPPPGSGLVGLALFSLCVVGLLCTTAACYALATPDFVGAGVLGIAAALSFGLLLNAIIRR